MPLLLFAFGIVLAANAVSGALRTMRFVVVVLHEVGHWLAAKGLGLYAPIFSLSPFGEPCHAFLRAFGTEFRWSPRWVEGSYVCVVDRPLPADMLAEIEEVTGIQAPPQPVVPWWQSVIVDAAGPFANVLMASVCFIWAYCLLPGWTDLGIWLALFVSWLALFGLVNARSAIVELIPRQGSDGWKIISDCYRR